MARVTSVAYHGAGATAGIKRGDDVTEINGAPFADILDYIHADGEASCTLRVRSRASRRGDTLSPAVRDVCIKKTDPYQTIGLDFDDSVQIVPKTCINNCVFCFVNQMPKGFRDTLYVKDDDYRLSFSSGSFVTLTNLTEADFERIISYKLSPLYISVHATDEDVRQKLLGVKKAPPILPALARLHSEGIILHAQIVLVPTLNDGKILAKTLTDLSKTVDTVAIVPVGLTGHRDGLPQLTPLTRNDAEQAIKAVAPYKNAFCADEIYNIAGTSVPAYDTYGDFPQIENGVGLTAKFLHELTEALADAPKKLSKHIGIVTGVSGREAITEAVRLLTDKWRNLRVDVFVIKNTVLGETITVTGLVTAKDIIKSLSGKDLPRLLILPSVMLREGEEVFLDGMTVAELSKKLNTKIVVSAVDGECLVDTIIYEE